MRRQPRGGLWKNRIVGTGEEAVDQLLANPHNWRLHPETQQEEVEKLLETVGWIQHVIINRRTGHMVDGHLRAQLALRREEETVPVTYIDVSPAEERLILVTLDPLSAMAGRDDAKLAEVLADVQAELPAECEIDLDAILGAERKHAKGLSHEVTECLCCRKRCKRGCGCYEGD